MNLLNKIEILDFMRKSVAPSLSAIKKKNIRNQEKTKEMNQILDVLKNSLFEEIDMYYNNEVHYPNKTAAAFLVYYCWVIVSLECRNTLWNYESMDLSRRSGELWESLLKQCWSYPVFNTVKRFIAPDFMDVAEGIKSAFNNKLHNKQIEANIVREISTEYSTMWSILGDSINLNSDELFETTYNEHGNLEVSDKKYIIDFKGSYGSNEKGNKERLLTVARIYNLLNKYNLTDKEFNCILAVRTVEAGGHNYLRQLESSKLWSVLRGNEVYEMIFEFTGFDILSFVKEKDLQIMKDLNEETAEYMKSKITSKQNKTFADHYLTWW